MSNKQTFSTRIGFLLSVLGIAIGTGNIWRFPRIAASNGNEDGAGAFIFAWIIMLFLWSVPLIIAEYLLGKKYRKSVVGSFLSSLGGRFTWMGSFIALVTAAICLFYAVIVGWCIYYFFHMLVLNIPQSTEQSFLIWNNFQNSYWPLFFHALAISFGAMAIWKGVSSIEKVNRILIPTLLIILLLAIIRTFTLPGSFDGIAYLFTPDFNQLIEPRLWLEALTQNAWDTGAGWGLFLTYATYLKKEHGIVKNAYTTAIGNNFISLLAAIIIFGTVFSILQYEMNMEKPEVLDIIKTSGPAATGLTFIWIPQLFSKMFLGNYLVVLFFLGLTFAGFSSLIAMLELPTKVIVDSGIDRKKAIMIIAAITFLLGIPSSLNLEVLSNQDFVWGNALVISGFFIAFNLIRYGTNKIREEELISIKGDWKIGRWWDFIILYFVPAASIVLLFWWLSQSVFQDNWYDPFGQFTFMTNIFQWGIALSLLLILNRWISSKFHK